MEECNLHTIVRLPNSVFKGDLVLRAPRAGGPEVVLDDQSRSGSST